MPDVEDVAVLVDRHSFLVAPSEQARDTVDMVATIADLTEVLPLTTFSAGFQDQEFGFHPADTDDIASSEVVEHGFWVSCQDITPK
ncbi:MAG: hypothetical protein RI935_538 [Candidatus Parcubacteria bacterium]